MVCGHLFRPDSIMRRGRLRNHTHIHNITYRIKRCELCWILSCSFCYTSSLFMDFSAEISAMKRSYEKNRRSFGLSSFQANWLRGRKQPIHIVQAWVLKFVGDYFYNNSRHVSKHEKILVVTHTNFKCCSQSKCLSPMFSLWFLVWMCL